MISNHAPITKLHLTRNSRGDVQFFVETSDGTCYLTNVTENLSQLYYNFSLSVVSSSNSIEERLLFLNSRVRNKLTYTLVGSFNNLIEIADTYPELLL